VLTENLFGEMCAQPLCFRFRALRFGITFIDCYQHADAPGQTGAQVLGAISEFDKAMTVAKLRGAHERKRRDFLNENGRPFAAASVKSMLN
jgi:hypothetical protein